MFGKERSCILLNTRNHSKQFKFQLWDQHDAKIPRKCFWKLKCTCKTSFFFKHIPKTNFLMNGKFIRLIMYARRYANFPLLNFKMKKIYIWYRELRRKKLIKQSALKLMRIERQQVGYNVFNKELKYAKRGTRQTLMKILKTWAARNNFQDWVVEGKRILIIQKGGMFKMKTRRLNTKKTFQTLVDEQSQKSKQSKSFVRQRLDKLKGKKNQGIMSTLGDLN